MAMGIELSAEVVIDRTRRDVAEVVLNPLNDSAWIAAVRESRLRQPGPVAVGTQVERTLQFLGRRLQQILVVTSYLPGKQMVLDAVGGPVPMEIRYELDDVEGGTRARVSMAGDPGVVFRLARSVLIRVMRHTLARDLGALKTYLEG
jgi:hypothetical protein